MRNGVDAGPLDFDKISVHDRLHLDAVASRRVGRPMPGPGDGDTAPRGRVHRDYDGEQSMMRSRASMLYNAKPMEAVFRAASILLARR